MNKNGTFRVFNSFKIYEGLPNSIYILFIVKIINAMGNFVFPFLTLYLTKKMGMSDKAAGMFFTIAAISSAPGLIIGGRLADYIGRKKVFSLFQTASVLCFLPCAFLGQNDIIPWLLILSSFFNGGAQPALGAMINDLTNPKNRKQAFSLLYLGNNIGFAVGPLLAGFLFDYHTGLLFIGNFITGIFAVVILMKYVMETIPKEDKNNEVEIIRINEKAESGNFISILFKKPRLLVFAFVSIIYSFVYAQFPFSGSLQMKEVFSNGPQLYGVLMTINGFVVITMTTPIIKITSKIKPLLNVAISGIFFAVGMGMLYFINAFPLFILSTIIWTIGEILNATNAGVYIANNTPISHRGRFNALIPLITGSGFALGPLIMGTYINGRGVRAAWPLVFIVELGAAVMIFILYIIDKRVESKIR